MFEGLELFGLLSLSLSVSLIEYHVLFEVAVRVWEVVGELLRGFSGGLEGRVVEGGSGGEVGEVVLRGVGGKGLCILG